MGCSCRRPKMVAFAILEHEFPEQCARRASFLSRTALDGAVNNWEEVCRHPT
jgi:hypothetical protein